MKRKPYLWWILGIYMFLINPFYHLYAQSGANDATFNIADTYVNLNGGVLFTVVQPDGKILLGGGFSGSILRLNSDGSKDYTFNIGTGFNNQVFSLALQTDGKIVVTGSFYEYNGVSVGEVVRLNTDGSLDNSFALTGSGFNDNARLVKLQSDGKIIVGGDFTNYNGTSANRIARLNANGSLDNSFNVGSGFDDDIQALTTQTDGKIIAGGRFTTFNGNTQNYIIRLNADGSLDNSFNIGTGFNGDIYSIGLQADGKIVAVGDFTNYNGNTKNNIIRLNADGSLDNTFNMGTGFNNSGEVFKIQSDGKILVAGPFSSYNGTSVNKLVRLNTDGSLDNSFSINPNLVGGEVYSLEIQLDNKIIVVGDFKQFNGTNANAIVRLNANGALDTAFNTSTGFDGQVSKFGIQTDGKIIVGGSFTSYNRISSNRIARLNADGSLDNTFNTGTGFDSFVRTLIIQSDGKILVGGGFSSYNGTPTNRIVRLNADGSLDNSFSVAGSGFNSSAIYVLTIQTDGKIIVGGDFTSYNGTPTNRIIRLNTDGSIDNTFNIGTGFNGGTTSAIIQPDGKIVVGGYFTSYNGTTRNNIVRLNTDGSIDNTFNIGSGFDIGINSLYLQSNGKILAGGAFTSYNGTSINRIIRLNSDGSVDNTFNVGTGFNDIISAFYEQSDSRIIVGGRFNMYNGNISNGIVRLNSNGSVDNTFNAGVGFSNKATSFIAQNDNKLVVGGEFSLYQNVVRNKIARILLCPTITYNLSSLPNALLQQVYSQQLSQSGLSGTLVWSLDSGSLPTGLSLNSSTGLISGTPTISQTSNFTIKVSDGFCSATKSYSIFVDPIASVSNLENEYLKVYPNPVEDKVCLLVSQAGNYELRLFNSLGKEIKSEKTFIAETGELRVSEIERGVYFLEILGEGYQKTIRIVKQ